MPKAGKKLFDTGAVQGFEQCPCGYKSIGDKRSRVFQVRLHKKKCLFADAPVQPVINIPGHFNCDQCSCDKFAREYDDIVDKAIEDLKTKNGR